MTSQEKTSAKVKSLESWMGEEKNGDKKQK